jgi:hypothetical protein
MRISSWVIGFVSLIGVVLVTAACAVLTFGAVRGVVVDLWDSGVQVESPAEIVSAITNPSAFAQASPTPAVGGGETVVVLPSVTPMPTVVIETTDTSTDTTAETPVATSSTIDINTQAVQATPTPPTSADGQNVVLDASGDYTWRDPRQIRILLMGIDQRTGTGVEDRGPFRTDTMIVVNVDPVRRTAGVISFPRDLWVKIPNFDPARINTANYIGDLNAYPGGGGSRFGDGNHCR